MIHDTYLKIIMKHRGSKLILIFLKDKNVVIEPIILKNCDKKGIVADFERTNTMDVYIPFYNDFDKNILCLYNLNDIDLLNARKVLNFQEKMKDKVYFKNIIQVIKQAMNQYVNIIIKMDNKFSVIKCIFTNMGMSGITVKASPFYNQEQNLKFNLVFHVFDPEFTDLLNIDEN
jgi:hypothetical protein